MPTEYAVGNPLLSATPATAPAVHQIKVLTVNTHKGFTAFNRRFILPDVAEETPFGCKIASTAAAYGLHEPFEQFWAQDGGAVLAKIDSDSRLASSRLREKITSLPTKWTITGYKSRLVAATMAMASRTVRTNFASMLPRVAAEGA